MNHITKVESGQRYGRLTVLERVSTIGSGCVQVACICDCGVKKVMPLWLLKNGRYESCGCKRKDCVNTWSTTHGMSNTRMYRQWVGMKNRATNPKCLRYFKLGMDPRWMSFETFLLDMGEPAFPKAQIDRINNDLGYYPNNCRWATNKQNCNNKTNSKFYEYNGMMLTLSQIRDELGNTPIAKNLKNRIEMGYTLEEAINTPIGVRRFTNKPKMTLRRRNHGTNEHT